MSTRDTDTAAAAAAATATTTPISTSTTATTSTSTNATSSSSTTTISTSTTPTTAETQYTSLLASAEDAAAAAAMSPTDDAATTPPCGAVSPSPLHPSERDNTYGRPEKPKKAAYRQRAHCNPLSDSYIIYPRNPDYVDWSLHFPAFFPSSAASSSSSSSSATTNSSVTPSTPFAKCASPAADSINTETHSTHVLSIIHPDSLRHPLKAGAPGAEAGGAGAEAEAEAEAGEEAGAGAEAGEEAGGAGAAEGAEAGGAGAEAKAGEEAGAGAGAEAEAEAVSGAASRAASEAGSGGAANGVPKSSLDVAAREARRCLYLNTDRHPVSYPEIKPDSVNGRAGPRVEFLDVGCGFGGLLVSLGPRFPNTLFLGVEIREKVTNYVGQRIDALRHEYAAEGRYGNIAVLRTNVMKFLVNYIRKGQLSKMFFCFPDPHFKRSNWRRRIINLPLLSVYAYVMRPGGLLYTVTDVEDLHKWMRQALLLHPLFEEVPLDQLADDPCIAAIERDTEEGMKVERLGQPCYTCVFRRMPDLPVCVSVDDDRGCE